jgi:chemotaxis family two-component system sensor kinase Cph1
VVDGSLELLKPVMEGRDIDLRIGPLPSIDCDPALLEHVTVNLLSNAIKFTRGKTPAIIEVGHMTDHEIPVVYVRDNGVGFDMQFADKLFGIFQRLHRREDYDGVGVGLATVQRIVNKHGGRIWAESEPDKGTTFYFTLNGAPGTPK